MNQAPKFSGGPFELTGEGWALIPFRGSRGHYWHEVELPDVPHIADGGRVRAFESVCGLRGVTTVRVPAQHAGDFGHCKRCEAMRRRA